MQQRVKPTDRSPSQHPLRVLIVDDYPLCRELVACYLERAWPFDGELVADFARDGREALAKIQSVRFALVVLDWNLPVAGEGEVLRQLRANRLRIPVVVVSGLLRSAIADDLEALEAAFLQKDQLNTQTFRKAITASLTMLGFTKLPRAIEAVPPDSSYRVIAA